MIVYAIIKNGDIIGVVAKKQKGTKKLDLPMVNSLTEAREKLVKPYQKDQYGGIYQYWPPQDRLPYQEAPKPHTIEKHRYHIKNGRVHDKHFKAEMTMDKAGEIHDLFTKLRRFKRWLGHTKT